MKVVILAGGKGTRLGLKDVPKPMVQIGDKKLLEHQIALVRRYGCHDVFILAGHLAHVIFDHFGDGSSQGVRLTYINEPYPLGTAGSVAMLKHLLSQRFLLLCGDVMFDMDLDHLMAFDQQEDSLGTLVVHPNAHPHDSDLVEIDEKGNITKFLPTPRAQGIYHSNKVNAGICVLSSEIFDHIPYGKKTDFGSEIFPGIVEAGGRLRAYSTTEFIHDIGTPDRLERVARDLACGRIGRFNRRNRRPAIFLDRDGVLVFPIDHLSRPEQLTLLPGAAQAVAAINDSDYLAVLVTNQPMLAKGFMTMADLCQVHNKLETLLGESHAFFDALYYCPHHPQAGFAGEVSELKISCSCRKPNPGMLVNAAGDLNIDLSQSWMIGDQECDLLAGMRAGCRTLQIGSAPTRSVRPEHQAGSLLEAVNWILSEAASSRTVKGAA